MAIVQFFYEKDLKKLDYSITNSNIQDSNTINKTSLNINPIEVQNLFQDIVVDSKILTINIPQRIPVVREKKEKKLKKIMNQIIIIITIIIIIITITTIVITTLVITTPIKMMIKVNLNVHINVIMVKLIEMDILEIKIIG